MTRHKKHRIKLRSMYQWHRYLGVTAALFVILLTLTGLLLNHTDRFELDQRYVESDWLLDHYGITAPATVPSYPAGTHWLSQWEDRLFLDAFDLGKQRGRLLGATLYQGMIVAALDNSLLLLTPQGELIDTLGATTGLPDGIHAIGITGTQQLAVKTNGGVYLSDAELLKWQAVPAGSATLWSKAETLPPRLHRTLLRLYRGKGLSMERIILDLHSGRILGDKGVLIMDAAALLLLFLALSGAWLWSMRIIRDRQRRRAKH